MLRTRAIVTLIGVPVVFALIYVGGWLFFAAVALIILFGVYEYCVINSHLGWHLPQWLLMACILLLLLTNGHPPWIQFANVSLAATLVISILCALWQYEVKQLHHVLPRWFAFVSGLVLFGWMGSHLLKIRAVDLGEQWTIAIVGMIFAVDVGAYLVGRQWGRRPLAPRLSPKKSIEGYLGGLFLGVPVLLLLKPLLFGALPWGALTGLAILFALILPAGDLFFSLLKREAGIKDASKIIPGHGGILDRLDTVLWGSTIGYYILVYLIL